MKNQYYSTVLACILCLTILLVSCNSSTVAPLEAIETEPQTTADVPEASDTQTSSTTDLPEPTETQAQPTNTPSSKATRPPIQVTPASANQQKSGLPDYPLSSPGPYLVGNRSYTFTDENRNGREVQVTVWYPAMKPTDANSRFATRDAEVDRSGAPYPLILSSTKAARIFAPYVVTHGFTWASVDKIDAYDQMNQEMIDQPLDILFALDQVGSNSLQDLDGMIDDNHTGTIGYSFDGYNSLAMSGARIDPEFYLSLCPSTGATFQKTSLSAFSCVPARMWDKFIAYIDPAITTSDDGLWQALTDERIKAVMPMAGEGWWLFGERGLAYVDRPTLMIVGAEDEIYPENVTIYEHLGTPEKALISFENREHMMIYNEQDIARMAHFAVAFFGYHLQGQQDYAQYFSQEFVEQQPDLLWGPATGEQ